MPVKTKKKQQQQQKNYTFQQSLYTQTFYIIGVFQRFNDSHRMSLLRIAKYPRNRPVFICVCIANCFPSRKMHIYFSFVFFFGVALLYCVCVYHENVCFFVKYSLRIFIQLFKCFFFFIYVHTHTLYSVHTVRIRNAKQIKMFKYMLYIWRKRKGGWQAKKAERFYTRIYTCSYIAYIFICI